jgi:hypothetical protein
MGNIMPIAIVRNIVPVTLVVAPCRRTADALPDSALHGAALPAGYASGHVSREVP